MLFPISQEWFVDPTGKVGLGTKNPQTNLEVFDPGTLVEHRLSIGNGGVLDMTYEFAGNRHRIGFTNGAGTPGAWLVRVDNTDGTTWLAPGGGKVGIGTASPSEKLHVIGNILASGTITPSDRRFKKDVVTLDNALARVLRMRGVVFSWRPDEFPERGFSDARQVGFIAQEMKEIVPEIVFEGSDGYLSIDYAKLTPFLVEAIQTQEEELAELRRANEELDRRVADLEAVEARLQRIEGTIATLGFPK